MTKQTLTAKQETLQEFAKRIDSQRDCYGLDVGEPIMVIEKFIAYVKELERNG